MPEDAEKRFGEQTHRLRTTIILGEILSSFPLARSGMWFTPSGRLGSSRHRPPPNRSAAVTFRVCRLVQLAKVAGKDTRTVVTALIKQAKKLPKELYKSLTWDRGKELTAHRRFTLATNIDVYFCDPQSPWQR